MKKIIFCISFMMLFSTSIFTQNSVIRDYKYIVQFDTDKDDLNQHAKSKLEKRLSEFINLDIQSIQIIGHTDNRGSLEYNEDLSLRRAQRIQELLTKNGLGNYPISMSFKGETEPRIMDNSSASLAKNRRVEIWVYAKHYIPENKNEWVEISRTTTYEKIIPNEPVEEPKEELTDYQKFHIKLDKDFKNYKIKSNNKNLFETEEGTIFFFYPNSFCDCKTKEEIDGIINIQIKEYYTISDFLNAGLSTSANDKVLQSAGTISIKAFYNDKEVCLKNRQEYHILFPKNKMNEDNYEDMNLFVGNLDEDGEVNWGVMGKNRLENWNAVNFNNLWRGISETDNCYRGECKLKFFKRVSMFFANHDGWKRYKFGRSPQGKKERNRLRKRELEMMAKRNSILENFEGDFEELVQSLGDLSSPEDLIFNYYLTTSTELDLINCDRFFNTPKEELQLVTVPIKYTDKISAKLIMKSENAIVRGYRATSGSKFGYGFGELPKGESVIIIAYDYSKKIPKLAKKEFKIGESIVLEKSDFKEYSLADFKKQLSALN